MHLPSLRIHQNLTYAPQAKQELYAYQDTLVPPGITFAIVHHFTRSSMYSSTHFIPKHIILANSARVMNKLKLQLTIKLMASQTNDTLERDIVPNSNST